MVLVHDLAECIVGDITPSDGIDKEKKHQMELVSYGPILFLMYYRIVNILQLNGLEMWTH